MVSYTQGNVTYQGVIGSLNILDYDYYFRFTDLFLEHKISETMLLFDEVLRRGFDGGNFITNLTAHLRDLLVSREPATLPLLEVSADVRERYREQAQKCPERMLIHAIKLCNDCDLNYRASKNKRLLVELTLIQLAQLTGDPDEIGSGRGPKRLKPLFQKAVATATTSQPKNSTPAQSNTAIPTAQPANSRPMPNAVSDSGSGGGNPMAQLSAYSGKPTAMRRPQSMSIRAAGTPIVANTQAVPATVSATPTHQTVVEDLPVSEEGLRICWKQFAASLPKEESAMAGRLMNIRPKLNDDNTFNVTIDNKLVAQELHGMQPRIEQYLRKQMQNSRISMRIRVEDVLPTHRILSRVEQYQILENRNSALKLLTELLNLDLE